MRKVRSGDAELAVWVEGDEGDAGKPWLLVSNSVGADHTMWDDQEAAFAATHRVVRYDTRGHGRSSAPARAYAFDDLVADMLAILDDVGAARADVVGLSLGGMTALGLALERPDRVGRLVVADARADATPEFVSMWDDRVALVRAGGMAAIVEGTLARWFTPAAGAATRARAERMLLATDVDGYIGCARALQRLDYLRRLGDLRCEVLYVAGGEDPAAPVDVMAAMTAATPGARIEVLPGLAHVPNMEAPDVFNRAVLPFLAPR